jgi:hypothetical protein
MMINRCFAVLLLTLGLLSTGWLVLTGSTGAQNAQPPKVKKPKEPKDLKVEGEITADDAKDTKKTDMHCKVYKYKMVKGETYQIDMKKTDDGSNLDPFLRLENPKGVEVADDDDGGGADEGNSPQDAKIVYKATETGEFKVIATTYGEGQTGKFTLTIKKQAKVEKPKEDPKKEEKAIELKLKDGKGSLNASLAAGDSKFMNKLQKTFEVKLEEGKTYQFDLMSAQFDAYLFLVGPDGKVLAEDDDSGGGANGLDSRIVLKIEKSGTYRLVASSFGGGETGEFTLSVEKQ